MSDINNKIEFINEDTKEKVLFNVIEQITINNATYLLVSEEDEDMEELEELEKLEVYVLKEKYIEEDDIVYDMVENDEELTFVLKIFEDKIEEFDLEL